MQIGPYVNWPTRKASILVLLTRKKTHGRGHWTLWSQRTSWREEQTVRSHLIHMRVPFLLRFLMPGRPAMHMRQGQAAFREAQRDFAQRDLDMYDSVWFHVFPHGHLWLWSSELAESDVEQATLGPLLIVALALFVWLLPLKARGWCQLPWLGFGESWQATSQKSTSMTRRQYS